MDVPQPSLHQLNTFVSFCRNDLPLLPRSHPLRVPCVSLLAVALLARYEMSRQRDDLEQSILRLTELIFLPRQPEDVKRSIIYLPFYSTSSHVITGFLVELKLGDVMSDIEEMAVLCHELLNSDVATTFLPGPIMALFRAAELQLDGWKANRRLPDLDQLSLMLAALLYSHDDYEEGTAVLDKIIAFRPPGDRPSLCHEEALGLIAIMIRKPEHSEEGIHRFRTFLDGSSPEDPSRRFAIQSLTNLQRARLDDFGVTGDPQDKHSSNSELVGRPSFRDLSVSLSLNSGESPSRETELQYGMALMSLLENTDVADIQEAVKYCRLLGASSHSNRVILRRAFLCTNKIEYLNEAICINQAHINPPPLLQRYQFPVILELIVCLSIRFNTLHHREDFNEIMQLFPVATPDRFRLSCDWASTSRRFGHPSASTAYNCAISLMQEFLTFAPTLHIQHFQLKLPLDYASFQVHTGRLHQAIETLERGRALLWSEMRGFPNSRLADRFAAVNRDLEMLTWRRRGVYPFGHLVQRQRKLLDDRNKLISQIQAMPGFETFLKSPSFDNLCSVAAHGPVIMINHCRWRSDILILLHDSPPSLIPMPNDFYDRANKLRDQLLDARKKGLESNEYEDALCSVLKDLYDLVGRPAIQRLNELGVPEQSRVWLCPTSAFCSLPLHAMGPIPSDDATKRYFLDFYIPSYTPTLSALIESKKPGSQTLDKPSILLVVQPDASMEEALEEMQIVQAVRTGVTTLISARATPTAVLERLRDHRFAHFICHGILEAGKPFDASFKLYKDRHLTLLDIARPRLPNAEFAFLSACHTAGLTDESIADEALHLTAAMQFCGFRSVVGTIWAMADTDGQDLARDFYKAVFSRRRRGVQYYERTAEALRDAVRKLRKKRRITLERWVNFVHYGA
ncbi:CHAT domain-containing protein [Russula compacta]|nr:CHAT domain-containing protein [Russula compacta]